MIVHDRVQQRSRLRPDIRVHVVPEQVCAGSSGSRSEKTKISDLRQIPKQRTRDRSKYALTRTTLWRRWDSNPRPPACKAGALAN